MGLLLACGVADAQEFYRKVLPSALNNSPNTPIAGQKKFGISIHLYRTDKAESIDDLKDLDEQIAKRADTELNLEVFGEDLALIFLNNTDPFIDQKSIPIRMMYGFRVQKSTKNWLIGGFLPYSEVVKIAAWIKENKFDTYDGFSKAYDNLSLEVKKQLLDFESPSKSSLFNQFVRPLSVLYFTAVENQNAIIFVGD